VSSFELAVRERTRTKYIVAVFGPVHECDDVFFCQFKEILKRSLVNEVGPVQEWVFPQNQIALDMIEYVLSLAENTQTTLISCKPQSRREVV
jgi:hypothetical protein